MISLDKSSNLAQLMQELSQNSLPKDFLKSPEAAFALWATFAAILTELTVLSVTRGDDHLTSFGLLVSGVMMALIPILVGIEARNPLEIEMGVFGGLGYISGLIGAILLEYRREVSLKP